ncbi:aminotransferase class V-fold PLP-dependent enzyme [Gammaproteobacteria bacterium]|nr:aminotransferase class V-fold PLP-dependent enzyme [Gammaproteobacteria bacterium]
MKQHLLFTPGPVNLAQNVREAICKQDICHREIDFDYLLQSIENKLLALFEIKNKEKYRAVVITGSGTAANESMLSSVVAEKNILILSNGEFGERLHDISKIHNKNTFLLDFNWGEELSLNKIKAFLQMQKIDVIAMVHHETSSGMLNPLEKIGKLAKSHGAIFIVDCVSSAGAEVINLEKCNIAFCSSSSSKAIGSYPGLSFVVGETQEFEKLKNLPIKSMYLNLYKFYEFIKTVSQTPNTPAVHLFYALDQALSNILNEGIQNRYANLRDKAKKLRQGMLNLGLKFVIDEKDMCSILTAIYAPSNVDVSVLRQRLREKSIIIYEGKGCFKDLVFQVGNIGDLSFADIKYFLDSLKKVLDSFKPMREVLPIIELVKVLSVVGTESQIQTSTRVIKEIGTNALTSKATL